LRSAVIIVAGLALLAVFVLAGRYFGAGAAGAMARAALVFLPVWLVVAAINMWMGVAKGYSLGEEMPIFALIFAIPAAAAAFAWWRWTQP